MPAALVMSGVGLGARCLHSGAGSRGRGGSCGGAFGVIVAAAAVWPVDGVVLVRVVVMATAVVWLVVGPVPVGFGGGFGSALSSLRPSASLWCFILRLSLFEAITGSKPPLLRLPKPPTCLDFDRDGLVDCGTFLCSHHSGRLF